MTDADRGTRVSWAENETAPVRTVSELDQRLDELDRQARETQPFVAEIARPDGAVLSIGLGRDTSVLNYSASPDPPYFTSHDHGRSGHGTVVFYFYGHWSEFPADAAVPMTQAREAARRFMQNGQRPDNIHWRQD
jgi:hypothetical protein